MGTMDDFHQKAKFAFFSGCVSVKYFVHIPNILHKHKTFCIPYKHVFIPEHDTTQTTRLIHG